MFFIYQGSPFHKKEIVLLHALPTAFVVVILLIVSVAGWTYAKRSYSQERQTLVQETNIDVAQQLQKRILTYEDILRTTASIFTVKETPTRQDWRLFVEGMDIMNRYPGVQGIGYAPYIRDSELSDFTSNAQQLVERSYKLFPSGNRPIYTPIQYLEPSTAANVSAIGYDMFSDNVRRDAIEAARDSGIAVLSSKVTLVQEKVLSDPQPGFLMYLAVYSQGGNSDSIDERSKNVQGFVYMPFRTHDFMGYTIDTSDNRFAHVVKDGKTMDSLYSTESYKDIMLGDYTSATNILEVAGSHWELTTIAPSTIPVAAIQLRPNVVLAAGVASSLLIGTLMYLIVQNRARSLAQTEERAIRDAKDELLALASHQLRTPATGVKQYIGMLREGLAGRLTDTQYNIVEKAYQSNERQLSTINEMLFVARSDAGHLRMDMRRFDFKNLVIDILDEHRATIEKRHLKLRTNITKKNTTIRGDIIYLRMAVENILSNAIKYTPDKGSIFVALTINDSFVMLKVKDNGVGVEKKDQGMLFQKFSRIPNKMSGTTAGSGIGLYLAQSVVKSHSGIINFSSDSGKGSTVKILLPLKVSTTIKT